jgi:hypothetical protein
MMSLPGLERRQVMGMAKDKRVFFTLSALLEVNDELQRSPLDMSTDEMLKVTKLGGGNPKPVIPAQAGPQVVASGATSPSNAFLPGQLVHASFVAFGKIDLSNSRRRGTGCRSIHRQLCEVLQKP